MFLSTHPKSKKKESPIKQSVVKICLYMGIDIIFFMIDKLFCHITINIEFQVLFEVGIDKL